MNNLNIRSSLELDIFMTEGVEVLQLLINTRAFSFLFFFKIDIRKEY